MAYFGFTIYYYCSKCYKKHIVTGLQEDKDRCNCSVDYIKIQSNQIDYKERTEEMEQKRIVYLRTKKLERIINI